MRYRKPKYTVLLYCLTLLALLSLRNLPGHAQNSIFNRWGLLDRTCSGSTIKFNIGYEPTDTIVLTSSEPAEPGHTTPSRMFIPDGQASCGDNGCVYSDTISFTGYSDSIHSVNDIKYIRLNIEHQYMDILNINIVCPNNQRTSILNMAIDGDVEYLEPSACYSSIVSSSHTRTIGENDFIWPFLGDACYDCGDLNTCDSASSPPGTGWNYCWSQNNEQGYTWASNDYDNAFIYRSDNIDDD